MGHGSGNTTSKVKEYSIALRLQRKKSFVKDTLIDLHAYYYNPMVWFVVIRNIRKTGALGFGECAMGDNSIFVFVVIMQNLKQRM
jgi:hypothetical protein